MTPGVEAWTAQQQRKSKARYCQRGGALRSRKNSSRHFMDARRHHAAKRRKAARVRGTAGSANHARMIDDRSVGPLDERSCCC